MSSINNVGGNSPIGRIVANPIHKQVPAEAPKQLPAADKLQLSGLSHMLKLARDGDVRVDKVAQIKQAIAEGQYEDDAKLDVAVDRLLDDLLK
jgi:anti-sigma28 factor (negative regulator of flagellin synthesis)